MARMGDGSWVARLGAYPGIDGEDVGLWLEPGEPPRVVHLARLPAVAGEARTRLVREVARAAEVLHHPNILAPLAIEEVDGGQALVVEHADGETLREVLAVGGRLPAPVAARVVRDACAAVHFAHEEGHEDGPFVHGWIEPGNLVVSRAGVTLVGGFGVGSSRPAASLMPWQSPEQILGGPRAASRQSDVYLLGLVLHACLAGENPFAHEPDPGVAILSRPPPSLEPLGVPPALAAVARRALSVKAADRFATAEDMGRAVDEAVPDLATPGAVAAWIESLFPAGMGLRAQRQRAVESAWQAARTGRPREPAAEEIGEEHILDDAASPGEDASGDEILTGQFQLAAPPFSEAAAQGGGGSAGGRARGPAGRVEEGRAPARGSPLRAAEPGASRPASPGGAQPSRPPPGPSSPAAPASAVRPGGRGPSGEATGGAPPPGPAWPGAAAPAAHATAGDPGRGPADAAPGSPQPAVEFSPIPPPPPRARRAGRAVAVGAVALAGLAVGWWLSAPPGGEGAPAAPVAAPPADGEPRHVVASPPPAAPPGGAPENAVARRPASPADAGASRPGAAPSAGSAQRGVPLVPGLAAPSRTAPSSRARAPATTPSSGTSGTASPVLEVLASEPGELFIDGRRAGRPPLQRAVAAGRREIRLLEANLGLDVTRVVDVRAPRTSVRIDVGKARLTVRAPELAEIALDGRVVARGSVRDMEIWEGRHRIEVTLGDARDRHDFRVGANETYEYDVEAVAR
jgi:serine/threonine-protein kinase